MVERFPCALVSVGGVGFANVFGLKLSIQPRFEVYPTNAIPSSRTTASGIAKFRFKLVYTFPLGPRFDGFCPIAQCRATMSD